MKLPASALRSGQLLVVNGSATVESVAGRVALGGSLLANALEAARPKGLQGLTLNVEEALAISAGQLQRKLLEAGRASRPRQKSQLQWPWQL